MYRLFKKILVIGAHADDVELFAGGTISRFCNLATVLVFSQHRGQQRSPMGGEFHRSMEVLGVDPARTHILDYPACVETLDSMQNKREELAHTMRNVFDGHTLVITHQSTDTNQDHQLIHREVVRVFKGCIPIICGQFPNNDVPMADRRFFVELSESNVTSKIGALSCYESQHSGRPYFGGETIRAVAQVNGAMIGKTLAEAFEVIRLWA